MTGKMTGTIELRVTLVCHVQVGSSIDVALINRAVRLLAQWGSCGSGAAEPSCSRCGRSGGHLPSPCGGSILLAALARVLLWSLVGCGGGDDP